MKVYIINLFLSRQGGGIFTVLKELYYSKVSQNYFNKELTFIGFEDENYQKDRLKLNGVSIGFKKENAFFYSKKFKNHLFNNIEIDSIIHLHSLWMYSSILLLKLNRNNRFYKIISPHGMLDKWALNNGSLKKKISLLLFEKRNINSANCVHALCTQEYKDIRKISKKVPIAIIPNGINLPLNISYKPKSEKNILFLARLHPKKGLDNLIEAWAEVHVENWNLIIVGPDEGNYELKINKINKNLNVNQNKIEFIDGAFGKDKVELYENASLFILPSYSEGLPMTILEAWSYKVPVLMTKECNLDIGFNEKAAIEITSTKEGILKGLNTCINILTDEELAVIGNNGYELVKKEFTWEEVSKKMIKMYEWVSNKTEKPNFIHLN
ncbi:glycosyltransferase [Polaribacter sp. Hel1_85]|uniref:glycosyltransferase n=1 Tax=Polaribacter sp. Hel1_85 TaxID=1250005 RepID=UPI00055FDDA0|nr:glycosyltransferase [Polaribacter sp. Hel1_85]